MESLSDGMQALCAEAPPFTPKELANPNNKWLARSALQKAIRRGQVDKALPIAEKLYGTDPKYAWSGLATIIVEDIGFGDLDLVSYSTVCQMTSVTGKMHAEMLYAGMVHRAACSPKTRSCCELSLGADLSENSMSGMLTLYADFNDETLRGLMLDTDPVVAYCALVVLRKRLRGKPVHELIETVTAIHDGLIDKKPEWRRAAMLCFERAFDGMHLALFPLLRKDWNPISLADETGSWPPSIEIKTVGSEAFDMHTRTGKTAIRRFFKTMKDSYSIFLEAKFAEPYKAMGALIFIAEGGLVDQRIVSPELDKLRLYQDEHFAIGYGCPKVGWEVMLEHVRQDIPVLNECRVWANNQES